MKKEYCSHCGKLYDTGQFLTYVSDGKDSDPDDYNYCICWTEDIKEPKIEIQ